MLDLTNNTRNFFHKSTTIQNYHLYLLTERQLIKI